MNDRKSDYCILISRGDRRPSADLYAFGVRQAIPRFPLPLALGDVEPLVDLQTLLKGIYDRARYYLAVDYQKPTQPPLSEKDATWAEVLMQEKGH